MVDPLRDFVQAKKIFIMYVFQHSLNSQVNLFNYTNLVQNGMKRGNTLVILKAP